MVLFSLQQELSFVNGNDGILLSVDIPHLSLPFLIDERNNQKFLTSHFPERIVSLSDVLQRGDNLEVLFEVGNYYIDPTWIKRERAHAPTEVKAVFSVSGPARPIEKSREEAIAHLDQVRLHKQQKYLPDSKFTVLGLPQDYLDENLALIRHFEIEVSEFKVHHFMALTHLSHEHREFVIEKLKAQRNPQAYEAAKILNLILCQPYSSIV